MKGFGNALAGAIVGVLATAIVGGGIAYFTDLRKAATDYAISQAAHYIIDHLQVTMRDGDLKPSERGIFYARCLKGEIIVGGTCGGQHAHLRGEGTLSNDAYYCEFVMEDNYELTTKNVRATAACLSAK